MNFDKAIDCGMLGLSASYQSNNKNRFYKKIRILCDGNKRDCLQSGRRLAAENIKDYDILGKIKAEASVSKRARLVGHQSSTETKTMSVSKARRIVRSRVLKALAW